MLENLFVLYKYHRSQNCSLFGIGISCMEIPFLSFRMKALWEESSVIPIIVCSVENFSLRDSVQWLLAFCISFILDYILHVTQSHFVMTNASYILNTTQDLTMWHFLSMEIVITCRLTYSTMPSCLCIFKKRDISIRSLRVKSL